MSSLIQPSKISPGFYKRSFNAFINVLFYNPIAYTAYFIGCIINEIAVPILYISSFIAIFMGLVLYIFTSYPTMWNTAKQEIGHLVVSGILYGSAIGTVYSILCLIEQTPILSRHNFSAVNEILFSSMVFIFFETAIHKCTRLYNIPLGSTRNFVVKIAVSLNYGILFTYGTFGVILMIGYSILSNSMVYIDHHLLIECIIYIASVLIAMFGCVSAHLFVQESFNIPKYQPETSASVLPSFKEHQYNVS